MVDESGSINISDTLQPSTFERNILVVAKGGGITYAGKLILAGSRFVTAVLLARLLGAEQYGLYILALSVGTLAAGLAILGLDDAVIRFVAIAAGRRDEGRVWGALQVCVGISLFLSVLVSTGLFALAYPIAEQVFHEPRLAPLLQFTSLIVPFLTLSDVLAGANRGFKKMEYPVIAQNIAQPMIRLILIGALAIIGLSAVQAVITYGLADFSASIIMLYFLNKQFALRRPLRTARRETRTILSFAVPYWLSGLLATFRGSIQALLLGTLSTVKGVGIFSIVDQLNAFGGQFASSITISVKPIVAELHDHGDRAQLGRIYQTTTRWSLAVQIPIFLALVLLPTAILSIFGKSFTDGAAALAVLALADLINVGTGMCGTLIDMTGHTKLKLANSIIRLVLYLGLGILLVPRWGVLGSAVAALVGEGTINVLRLIEVYILFRLWPYNRSILKPIAAGVLALISVLIIGMWLAAGASLLYTVIQVAVIFGVYLGANLLLGLSPEDREMLARVYRRARVMIARN